MFFSCRNFSCHFSCFLVIEFFTHPGCKLPRYKCCRYCLLIYSLLFQFLGGVFESVNVFNFNMDGVMFYLPTYLQILKIFCFLLKVLCLDFAHTYHLLWIYFCVQYELGVKAKFFFVWILSYLSTIHGQYYPFLNRLSCTLWKINWFGLFLNSVPFYWPVYPYTKVTVLVVRFPKLQDWLSVPHGHHQV